MANETILLHLKVGVPAANTDAFKALMGELVAISQNEPGTLCYEWYAAGETWHIIERYANGVEGDKHVKGFAENFAGRFFELIDGCEGVVSDNATPYIRGVLEGVSPLYVTQQGGFHRF